MNLLLRTLQLRDELSEAECVAVDGMIRNEHFVSARSDFVMEGDRPSTSCVMLSGLSARYNIVSDGKRQISAIHVPGDFVDLHSFLIEPMDHSVTALTDCTIARVPHEMLRVLTRSEPHLARMLWLMTVIDGAIFRQWLIASARLPADRQLCRFFCEIYSRLDAVGLAEDFRFDLPISQSNLSDAMGLSLVHVNKSLQRLRRAGLLKWQGSKIELRDWKKLVDLGEFDPAYLNFERKRR